jgi:hypothetical protein
MSYHADDDQHLGQPWFQNKRLWIIGGCFLCLLATSVGIFTYVGLSRIPDVGGGLTIEADPDTRIYIGEQLVGTAHASFTWEELFGDERHKPIALELTDSGAKVTPEVFSGPGAKGLNSQTLGGGSSMTTLAISGDKYMIRRANGALDEVFAYVIDWAPPNQAPRRFLIPIRVRKGAGASASSFNEIASGSSGSGVGPGFVRAFGKSPIEIEIHRKFSAGSPPAQFAEEIKTKGLWEPGSEK